ncbi:TetR/AcrR family transcriptional regulator, partial [Escherichia coli]|nr:TetR/AcrR family transcriptional regulator [Escherichia coli]
PPGCLLVQGGLACGAGSENIPFELAARRAQSEMELRERFVRAREDGDLPADADPVALARFLSTVASGMGVLASSGADREALREVARVSLRAFAKGEDV